MIKTKCECGIGIWQHDGKLYKIRPVDSAEIERTDRHLIVAYDYAPHRCKFYKAEKEKMNENQQKQAG